MKRSLGRYDTFHLTENQYEPGSRGRVLKNLLGIKSLSKMNEVENIALRQAEDAFFRGERKFSKHHRFTAKDICDIHGIWLGKIYEWAGRYRQVTLTKDDFPFAPPAQIPNLMEAFEEKFLKRYTPCNFSSEPGVVEALAVVHTELILIHPFREGNGRVARTLATLMALQADLPALNFSSIVKKRKREYTGAIHAGHAGNYEPIKKIFGLILKDSTCRNPD